ncbi:MAG: thioredoxin family protein [Candidatus Gracilibacteria bacterium]|nr:thioredoxin family protein [Candidatus Gracilibacteria bacterium]
MGNDNKSCANGECEKGKCAKMMMPMMIIVLVLIVAGVLVYSNSSKENSENMTIVNETAEISNNETIETMDDKQEWTEEEKKEMEQSETTDMNKAEIITNTISSGYREYSPELLSANTTNVLFFAATWCPSCQSADKNFSSETIPSNINLLKVDYDTYTDLKEKYGITMQHTFVEVDANGNEIKKWSGSFNVTDLVKEI